MTHLAAPPLPPEQPPGPPAGTRPALPFLEFVALLALLFSTVAFSTDAMLPMMSQMGRELSASDPTRIQLVITVFVAGLGLGTFVAGPLSDALGRKPVILGGIALYMAGAVLAAQAQTLEMLLLARFIQGLGAAGPRVVSQAMVRDLYTGRLMARVMSFAMTLFVLVPAVAPLIGAGIGAAFGWRAIFWSFLIFGTVSALWLGLRQPETLPPERRRKLRAGTLGRALAEVLGHARVRLYLAALTFAFAGMFVWISSVALIFDETYGRASEFPWWFALVALLSAPAALMNARFVMRLGMQRLILLGLIAQLASSFVLVVGLGMGLGAMEFWLFLGVMGVQFFTVASIFGNLNALALEPLGHVAGVAASVMSGISTMAAAVIATPVAQAFDGTPLPLALGTGGCALASVGFMLWARRLR
jgi:DHA1 family bicyclomycin/chloramphenicol resistance-like MFS transporter